MYRIPSRQAATHTQTRFKHLSSNKTFIDATFITARGWGAPIKVRLEFRVRPAVVDINDLRKRGILGILSVVEKFDEGGERSVGLERGLEAAWDARELPERDEIRVASRCGPHETEGGDLHRHRRHDVVAKARVPYRVEGDRRGIFRQLVVFRRHVLDKVLDDVVASGGVRLGIPVPAEEAQLADEGRGALRIRRELGILRKGAFLADERLDLFLSRVEVSSNQRGYSQLDQRGG